MPAKGSCCQTCQPCEVEVSQCDDVCVRCLPRQVCAKVIITAPVETEICCPDPLEFLMPMTCSVQPSWNGSGTCGTVDVSATITLEDNNSAGGCQVRVDVTTPAGIRTAYYAFTGFPLLMSFVSTSGFSYEFEFKAELGFPNPKNKLACSPCICARCLPKKFCVSISRTIGPNSPPVPSETCIPCFDSQKVTLDVCTGGGTANLKCGNKTYIATFSLAETCQFKFTLVGPDVSIDIDLPIESAGASTNGCYKCCRQGASLPMSRIGQCRDVTCSDCTKTNPADDGGCGTATLGNLIYGTTLFDVGVDNNIFSVDVKPLWCDEHCAGSTEPAFCCARLARATTFNCDGLPAINLADPGCNFPPNITLTIAGIQDIFCGVRPVGTNVLLGTSISHPDAPFDPIHLDLFCTLPTACDSVLHGDYPSYLRLVFKMAGDCIGNYCVSVAPNGPVSCRPFFAEFLIPMPPHNGLKLLAPDCPLCRPPTVLTFRLTEP